MKNETTTLFLQSASRGMTAVADVALMTLYRRTFAALRKSARLGLALFPLLVLLMGSCKTPDASPFAGGTAAEKFRASIFPGRYDVGHDAEYIPAAGYISGAKSLVADMPQYLNMLTRQEIGYIFGEPSLRRKDADAEVWQYRVGACAVDFYFYGHAHGSPLAHIDVRLKDELVPGSALRAEPATMREKSGCLREVVARGNGAVSI